MSVFVIESLIVVSSRCVSLTSRGEARSPRPASEAFAIVAVARSQDTKVKDSILCEGRRQVAPAVGCKVKLYVVGGFDNVQKKEIEIK